MSKQIDYENTMGELWYSLVEIRNEIKFDKNKTIWGKILMHLYNLQLETGIVVGALEFVEEIYEEYLFSEKRRNALNELYNKLILKELGV